MKIKINDTASEASEYLALILANAIRSNPEVRITFATGRTMDAVYHNLILEHKKSPFDCSKVKAFIVDEYVGLPDDSEHSYKYYMNLHLFERLNFTPSNITTPNVQSSDLDMACKDYEKAIKESGGIDILILGIGLNGHIGLNEPGSSIDSRTRVVALAPSTRNSNRSLFSDGSEVPLTAITIGVGTILESKKCYLLATGETKSEIIQKLTNGDVNSQVPASALKLHKDFELILDQEAAKLI